MGTVGDKKSPKVIPIDTPQKVQWLKRTLGVDFTPTEERHVQGGKIVETHQEGEVSYSIETEHRRENGIEVWEVRVIDPQKGIEDGFVTMSNHNSAEGFGTPVNWIPNSLWRAKNFSRQVTTGQIFLDAPKPRR